MLCCHFTCIYVAHELFTNINACKKALSVADIYRFYALMAIVKIKVGFLLDCVGKLQCCPSLQPVNCYENRNLYQTKLLYQPRYLLMSSDNTISHQTLSKRLAGLSGNI